jgi:hypothetical protein
LIVGVAATGGARGRIAASPVQRRVVDDDGVGRGRSVRAHVEPRVGAIVALIHGNIGHDAIRTAVDRARVAIHVAAVAARATSRSVWPRSIEAAFDSRSATTVRGVAVAMLDELRFIEAEQVGAREGARRSRQDDRRCYS